jgi:chromosomal replication initiation ATPase DnaA
MSDKVEMISPYSFPGLRLKDLDIKKYTYLDKTKTAITLSEIMRIVANCCSLTVEDLVSDRRFRELADARKIYFYAAKLGTNSSLKKIGNEMGGRDHTTVIHGATEFEYRYKDDENFRKMAESVLKDLNLTYQCLTNIKHDKTRTKQK